MENLIKEIQNTPIPTILIWSGLFIVVLAFVTKIGGIIEVSPEQKKLAIPTGLFLLTIGLILNFSTPSPTSASTSTSTSTPSPTSTPSTTSTPSPTSTEKPEGNVSKETLLNEILGNYENHQYNGTSGKNDWHYVTISKVNDTTLEWTNRAGVSWKLTTTPDKTKLNLGEDFPYRKEGPKQVTVVWEGDKVSGLNIGEFYEKSK